jgi:hypothetical protein
MPSVSFFNEPATITAFPNQYRYVRVKRLWADAWTFAPYLSPIRTLEETAPGMGAADFVYHFGTIKREHATTYSAYLPMSVRNWYIQVLMQEDGQQAQAMFHGVIADDQMNVDRPSSASGNQFLSAFGLGYLLDRIELTGSFVREGGVVAEIGRTVAFNERRPNSRGLGKRLLGNSSTVETGGTDSGVYAFERNGVTWSDLEVLRHLLYYYGPTLPKFTIAGQLSSLDAAFRVWDFEGESLWSAINKIIDRRRGLTFSLDTNGNGDVIIRVASVADVPFGWGAQQLPANDRPVFFSFPTEFPYTHLVDTVALRYTALNQFDEIEVRAKEPIKVCGTFSYGTNTLEAVWSSTQETDYKNGALAPPDRADLHDAFRGQDIFSDVYTTLRAPKNWLWATAGGDTGAGETVYAANPLPLDDGTVDVDTFATSHWNSGHRFYGDTPFEKNIDYSLYPPNDHNPAGSEPDYVPLIGFIKDESGQFTLHKKTAIWHMLDALGNIYDVGGGHGVQAMQHEIGVRVSSTPNHVFAGTDFAGAADSHVNPEFNWRKIGVTGFYATDHHQHIIITGLMSVSGDVTRRLVIEVPDCEFWYVVPTTVIGIDAGGNRLHIHHDNTVLRDDVAKLRIAAVYAAAWYGIPRQALTLPIKRLGLFGPLGAMLTEITDAWTREPVRTVITSRTCDYAAGTTVLQTGWGGMEAPIPVQGAVL